MSTGDADSRTGVPGTSSGESGGIRKDPLLVRQASRQQEITPARRIGS